VAWHTLSNFYYLVAPTRGPDDTKFFLEELTKFVRVTPTTTTSFRYAVQLVMKDFEDAMQVVAAMACDAEVIATRNLRDYVNAPIKACTPSSLLQKLD
jgi:PIN domain